MNIRVGQQFRDRPKLMTIHLRLNVANSGLNIVNFAQNNFGTNIQIILKLYAR